VYNLLTTRLEEMRLWAVSYGRGRILASVKIGPLPSTEKEACFSRRLRLFGWPIAPSRSCRGPHCLTASASGSGMPIRGWLCGLATMGARRRR
jgi:hypothetical protein